MAKRHILIGLLVLSTILTMVGPAFAQEPYKFPGGAAQPWKGVTLNAALVAESKPDALKKELPAFEQATGIKVNLDILPYATLQEKQLTSMTQGTGAYDIVHVDCVWMGQYAGQGWLAPVTDFVKQTDPKVLQLDDFAPRVLQEQSMWKDVLYGLPFINAVHVLYYRTDIFAKYNLKPPTTWDELYETAKLITEKEGPNGVYGVTFMGKRGVQLLCNYVGVMGAYGGQFYDEKTGKATLDSPQDVAALDYLHKLVSVANPGVLAQDYDECAAAFANGQAAMNLQWQNAAPIFVNPDKSKIIGKWDLAVEPGVKQTDGTILRSPCFGGWDMGIAADSKNKEAAWEFIVWATSPEMERKLTSAMPSSRKSILGDPELAKKYIEYPTMLASLEFALGRPRIPEWPQMDDIIQGTLSEAMTGAKTPEAAMKEANPLIDDILKQAGYQK